MTDIQGGLNQSTGKKTATGKSFQQVLSLSQFCSLLSHFKSRDKVLQLNFEPEDSKVSELVLDKMV